jgi:hypothetical protein
MKTHKMLLMSAALLALAVSARAEEPKDPFKKDSSPNVPPPAIAAADPKAEEEDTGGRLVSVELETFSLPMGEALALLRKFPTDAARYEELVRSVDAGKAKLEQLARVRTLSGNQATTKSVSELTYPTGFVQVESNKVVSAVPSAFKTSEVGHRLNVVPMLGGDDRTVQLTLVSDHCRFLRYTGDPGFQQPVFETQNMATTVTCRDGVPFLLGTNNPPSGNGLTADEKEKRVWLEFITARIVNVDTGSEGPIRKATPQKPHQGGGK